MARGIVKTNNGPRSSSSAGSFPVHTGTLEDLQTRTVYNFEQSLFAELGLAEGVKVIYNLIKDSNGVDLAIGLESLERGVVQSVSGEGGTLRERATGGTIDFAHSRTKEANIVVGSVVKFEKIDYGGREVAASITLIR